MILTTQEGIDNCRDQAIELFQEVFRTMLRLEVEPASIPFEPGEKSITSAVYFAGKWKGAAVVDCGMDLALEFTRRLMPGCDPQFLDDDVRDCMGELANMLGGNLKPLLPDGVELSMPSVVEGRNYTLRLCGAKSHVRLPFVTPEGPFWITVVEESR